jgi:hypothetical protein
MSSKRKEDPEALMDRSIGRPGPWDEGRYEKRDAPAKTSVIRKPGEGASDATSTPVTRKDYEQRPGVRQV